MTKDTKSIVSDYVTRLNDDDFWWLGLRLNERLGGDIGDAAEFLSQNDRMDSFLKLANTANEFYDCMDRVRDAVLREARRRGVTLK
jgi:hypothetical protein